MPGKLPPADLASHVFERTGTTDDRVLQGPADGEDAAAIDPPDGTLVVSSDPISLAAADVGTLGVHVACNDVAAAGADPRWLTVVCLLPGEGAAGGDGDESGDGEGTDDGDTGSETGTLEAIMTDVHAAGAEVGASVVGGHSEFVDALERPLLSLTAMGMADSFIRTGGAEPDDRVLLTAGAGVEGTAILAADFGDHLDASTDVRERATAFLEEISVVPAARICREHATAMHDPTEGGVTAGLHEIARASGTRVVVEREAIPVRPETATLCEAAGVDPLRIFGSGALLATVPPAAVEDVLDALADAGIEAADIGAVERLPEAEQPHLQLDDERITEPIDDDLYPLWADADAREES